MNALTEIKSRFAKALGELTDDPASLIDMIRPTQSADHGDYQANCAMPLGKKIGKPPREVADSLVQAVELADICTSVEVAGPGFINLKLDESWLKSKLSTAVSCDRLGVEPTASPLKYVVDFSSPNIAKEMHVGHIRSTVIGDAISKILKFVGHDVITDNHLGDWGTQFGMIMYGYKNFCDQDAYAKEPVKELGRLYKYVRKLMDYHSAVEKLPQLKEALTTAQSELEAFDAQPKPDDKSAAKKAKKQRKGLDSKVKELDEAIYGKIEFDQKTKKPTGERSGGLQPLVESIEADAAVKAHADAHPEIRTAVLTETSKLHAGDEENNRLWNEFLPGCREEIQKVYDRLNVQFDYQLGESFFHDLLGGVVENFKAKGLCKESEGAMCVFMENHTTPMIIQKSDGAYLYSTTDLATIKYRMDTWNPDAILYVVDHRQSEHFDKLFDAAKFWGYEQTEFNHVKFGTVLGEDGKPFKTRSGDAVGLEGLLDQAESRAMQIAIDQNEDLTEDQQTTIAHVVGIGGLKYADLSIARTSDYKFSYKQMLNLKGNTATYLQYGYARVFGIMRKGGIDDPATLREKPVEFVLDHPSEHGLAVSLIRFGESLDEALVDYKPNLLANYLYDLSGAFNQFFNNCPVLKAESEELKLSRLQLCDLTARTLKTGLGLLGIEVIEQM
jgi:arginyl-tRNA synthetase